MGENIERATPAYRVICFFKSSFARTLRANIDCHLWQISSRFAAYRLRRRRKYRFTYCPLIHRRRDGGPPSPQRFFQNRGKFGMGGNPTRRRSPAPRRSRPLFVTLSACHLSRYRESLPHKARQSRAGEGWCVGRRNDSDRQARTKTYVTKAAFKHVARICAAIHVQDT